MFKLRLPRKSGQPSGNLSHSLPNSASAPFHISTYSVEPFAEISYPLSAMQQGMLFHHLSSHPGLDIEQMVCTLREPIDRVYFEQAWQQVIERHLILRTQFRWAGLAQPQQCVQPQVELVMQYADWQQVADAEQQLQEYLDHDRQQGFDLGNAPLMRLALFQLGEANYRLVWTFHHILLDGRSFPILLQELFALYAAFCQGELLNLPQPPQYQTYIEWLQQQDWSRSESYWRNLLAGFKQPTPLPVEQTNATGYAEAIGSLSVAATAQLKAITQQHEITPNTLLQAAWALLLHRYSGATDLVFGATRACRHATVANAESMLGLFINTLPVRVQITADRPLLDWLQALRHQHLAIRPYEHTPLVNVQQSSELAAGTALFESFVTFENYTLNETMQALGGDWQQREFELFECPGYPLTLLGNLGEQLGLRLLYDRQKFSAAKVEQLLRQLSALLENLVTALATQPNQALGNISLLSAAERQQVLLDWNDTAIAYPALRLYDQFEAQVAQTPNVTAVWFKDQSLTYAELNRRANQLAHHIQKLGVRPETCVGICIERSLEMLVGLLAIVKAGGAYVPLDPSYPADRLAHIQADSQLAAVLTLQKFESLLPVGLPAVCLDRDWEVIAAQSVENPVSSATPANLAYVIYTSGSTGLPKGVLIEHRAAINTILDINRRFGVAAGDRVLAVCSLNFDLSVYDVFGLLGAGGTLILPSPAVAPDLNEWSALMHQHQVTVWNSAPPVMQMLAGHLVDRAARLPASLKLVMLSGDWIPVTLPSLIRQLKADPSPTQVISLGGATEASIWSNFYAIEQVDPSWKSIPYGRPLANQKFHILDEHQQPVAIGEVGELYIGGAGVARGYHNRPELNASKFIADPFANSPGDQPAKLYRTGDLGRYLPDGNMEFLGRIDHQIKIRGFRVELGEIEVALSQHPAVRDCAVLAQDDPSGTQRLVAYLVGDRAEASTITEAVRTLLKAKLPDYMLPSAFLLLDHLPLTPNGKLDRKALPAIEVSALPNPKTQVAPRNQTESQLVEIWQEFLNVRPIGITDNFFELGGHSLIAVRLWSKIEQRFGPLPLATLFQAPTIEQLAVRLQPEAQSDSVNCPSLVVMQPGQPDAKPPLFCIHVLGRGLKFYRPLIKYLDPEQPVYGLSTQIAGEDFPSNWVEDLAPHYAQQIQTIQPQGPYLLAGVSFGGLIAVEIARLLKASGQEVALLALLDTRLPGALQQLKQPEAASWRHLAEKGPSYLAIKAQRWLSGRYMELSESLQDAYFRLCIQFCARTGQPLQDAWQDFDYEAQNAQAISRYRPMPYDGDVTLFRATEQDLHSREAIAPELGWREMVTGELEIYQVTGSHLGMLDDPNAATIGVTLQGCIECRLR